MSLGGKLGTKMSLGPLEGPLVTCIPPLPLAPHPCPSFLAAQATRGVGLATAQVQCLVPLPRGASVLGH